MISKIVSRCYSLNQLIPLMHAFNSAVKKSMHIRRIRKNQKQPFVTTFNILQGTQRPSVITIKIRTVSMVSPFIAKLMSITYLSVCHNSRSGYPKHVRIIRKRMDKGQMEFNPAASSERIDHKEINCLLSYNSCYKSVSIF